MSPVLVGGAAVAAALLAALLWWAVRRQRPGRVATPEEVAEAADHAIVGFETVNAVVGADGAGALLIGKQGRVAAAKLRGPAIAVREIEWSAVRATPAGIVIETGERPLGRVMLTGVDVLDIRRLAPKLTRL